MFLLFLKSNWRGILVAVFVCLAVWLAYDYMGQQQVISEQKQKITELTDRLTAQDAKVAGFESAALQSEKNRHDAELARLAIISTLTAQVNTLRKQQPPKDCQQAVDWAVTNKGDLSWTK